MVDLDHGVKGGPRIPLVVGHPDVPGEMLVAVLTDDDAYVGEPSVRVRDRQVAERLEALGWTVVHIWSTAAFLDPKGEADAVCAAVLDASAKRLLSRRPAAVEAPVSLDEDADEPDLADGQGEPPAEADAPAVVRAHGAEAVDDPDQPVVDESGPAGEVGTEAGHPGAAPTTPAALSVPRVPAEPGTQGMLLVTRPDVRPGMPIGAYSDDELDDLVAWLRSDGVERDDEALADLLRAELGLKRRGSRIDATVNGAVRRSR